jgi:hypothetical protein
MPVYIARKISEHYLVSTEIGVEKTLFEVSGLENDYIVEAYIDIHELAESETAIIREYIALTGGAPQLFEEVTVSGADKCKVIRLHTKTLRSTMTYRVTITQINGTPRHIPVDVIIEVMGTT